MYRNMVHVGHLSSVVQLARASMLRLQPRFHGLDYLHASDLPRARCSWLLRSIRDESLTHAISVDSDSEFDASQLLECIETVSSDVAVGVVPFFKAGQAAVLNVNRMDFPHDRERPMRRDELLDAFHGSRAVPISSGGFGVAIFNLTWFRQCWKAPQPETWTLEGEINKHGVIDTGEDVALCRSVRKRGGYCVALRVDASHNVLVTTSADVPRLAWS